MVQLSLSCQVLGNRASGVPAVAQRPKCWLAHTFLCWRMSASTLRLEKIFEFNCSGFQSFIQPELLFAQNKGEIGVWMAPEMRANSTLNRWGSKGYKMGISKNHRWEPVSAEKSSIFGGKWEWHLGCTDLSLGQNGNWPSLGEVESPAALLLRI